jgi:hypothetical protein
MVYVRQLAYEALRSALRSMTLRVYVVWAVTDAIEAGYLKSRRFSCRFDAPHLVYQARSEKTLTYLTYLLVYRYALLEPAIFPYHSTPPTRYLPDDSSLRTMKTERQFLGSKTRSPGPPQQRILEKGHYLESASLFATKSLAYGAERKPLTTA